MNVAEEDTVGSLSSAAVVVEAEGNHVLHVVRVLERFNRCIEVGLVREVYALQNSALRIKKVSVVVTAAFSVFGQHAVGASTGTLPIATVKTQLFAAAVVFFADVCACAEAESFRY